MNKLIYLFAVIACITSCSSPEEKAHDKIAKQEKSFYADSLKTPDANAARELINSYKEFANAFPENEKSAEYLFRAGDMANGVMHNPNEAIEYYARVYKTFPAHEKAPFSLFLQGFLYENYLQRPEVAKPFYQEFLQKFPEHKLAKDAKFSLDHLGMSDEELIKMLEEKNKKPGS